MSKKTLIEKTGGIEQAKEIVAAIPDPEAKYYVLEKNLQGGTGFYSSAFHVGVHNPHTHINLEHLKAEIAEADRRV